MLFLLLLAGGSAYLLSASGLVSIPVFSQAFYREPKPTREVVYDPSKAGDLTAILEGVSKGKIDQSRLVISGRDRGIRVSEIELSSWVYKQTQNTFTNLEIAVFNDRLELFARLKKPKLAFLITTDIIVDDGKLSLELKKARVGSLALPKGFLDFAAQQINKQLAATQEKEKPEDSASPQLKSIEKHDGFVVLYLDAPL